MNVPMLKKVRAAILKRPRQFDMEGYFSSSLDFIEGGRKEKPSHCGTAACIAGWAIHLEAGRDKLSETDANRDLGAWDEGKQLLDIGERQAWRLFIADHWPDKYKHKYDNARATAKSRAKAAAARITHFIKTKGRE